MQKNGKRPQLYDEIGIGYGSDRRPDARIANAILHTLGSGDPS